LLRYFKETGAAKIGPAAQHVLKILEESEDDKVLVFAHHLEVLDGLAEIFTEKSIDWLRIDGNTSAKDKDRQLNVPNPISVLKN
jgi:SWI/SNF-related matrix-associated actin-dependent regulator 1 of chromatin subfamily A